MCWGTVVKYAYIVSVNDLLKVSASPIAVRAAPYGAVRVKVAKDEKVVRELPY